MSAHIKDQTDHDRRLDKQAPRPTTSRKSSAKNSHPGRPTLKRSSGKSSSSSKSQPSPTSPRASEAERKSEEEGNRRRSLGSALEDASAQNIDEGSRKDGKSEEELIKLRAAVNKRLLSDQQRALLAGKTPSPGPAPANIASPSAALLLNSSPGLASSIAQPSSADSARTVRVATGPGQTARTPSYPFPYVPGTPRSWSPAFHQPFTILSPTTSVEVSGTPGHGTISDASTPGPTFSPFGPTGFVPVLPGDSRYPTPNLYDLILQLNSEPGLDAWWRIVTKIFHDSYLADRVNLALPADSNDIENVPWGQKATFNVLGHDENSEDFKNPAHTPSIDQLIATGVNDSPRPANPNVLQARPGLESRHSYSGAGLQMKDSEVKRPDSRRSEAPARPSMPMRAATQMPSGLRKETFSKDPKSFPSPLPRHTSYTDPDFSSVGDNRDFIPHMSVFPALRGLDAELDGLIDSSGINRVLERGGLVTLTRDYATEHQKQPQTPKASAANARGTEQEASKNVHIKHSLPFRSIFSPESAPARRGSAFEEYEQQPPSPWSQSPAPSPAVQADPEENPFFAEDSVEDSFNPSALSPDYTNLQAIEAIGVDKAHTVIHLPLIHPTLSGWLPPIGADSKPSSLDSSPAMDRSERANNRRERRAPIAVISILSPAVPYPANLAQSLSMLGPHLAASFAIAQQITAMLTQSLGIRHKKSVSGKQLGPAPLSLHHSNLHNLVDADFEDRSVSFSGSITSPSDYSGHSKYSPGSSIAGTPGWDPSMPTQQGRLAPDSVTETENSGYFDRRRGNIVRSTSNASTSSPGTPARGSSARSPGLDAKTVHVKKHGHDDDRERRAKLQAIVKSEQSPLKSTSGQEKSPPKLADYATSGAPSLKGQSSSESQIENADRLHSVLHSYGADFTSSFPSLPAATNLRSPLSARSATHGAHISSALSEEENMPPPSERLLRTIIDSLPVQIFTAAPESGELTWVNSKFLVYRGQDSRQVLKDPWSAVHPDDRPTYMEQWHRSLRTGQQMQQKVRLQRFDGNYRWFYVRAAPLKDKRQSIVHWIGTNMDFHEQHTAELNSARQQETAASEAKYRALANSSPQVVFSVNRSKGITFCNTQWMNYSGQTEAQALGLGFVERVHPEDIVKCRLPTFDDGSDVATNVPTSVPSGPSRSLSNSQTSSSGSSDTERGPVSPLQSPPSANLPQRKLSELASIGILKVTRDADGRASYSTEVRLKSKDGEYRWHLVRVLLADNSIRLNDDEDETWYGTCTDINDHKALEKDLKETMDEKSRFLSNMSHEIRTPLNGITGMVNFLIDSNLNEEQMEHVNIIRASTEGLRGLINDILDLSKAEAGMIQLNLDWLYVRSLIEEVNDLTSAMAIDKGLELNYIVEANVPAQIKGDRFRIRQILLNVIGNAIKFTSTGEVFVRCSVISDLEHHLRSGELLIQFEVIDTGRGFTEKEAQHLFKRFSQIDGSSTRQHGGTGLGLVISRQLAQLHGGDMSARGYPGKGATFIFHIKTTLPSGKDVPPPDALGSKDQHMPAAVTAMKRLSAVGKSLPSLTNRPLQGSPLAMESSVGPGAQPSPDKNRFSPSYSMSSAGSVSSLRTSSTSTRSETSSASSYVARNSIPEGPDLDLVLPKDRFEHHDSSNSSKSSHKTAFHGSSDSSAMHPAMYSILVVCPLKYSRAATVQHIDMILPKNVPHQITARESLIECQRMIGGDSAVNFTHVVLALQSIPEVVAFMDQLLTSTSHATAQLIVITDLNHRRQMLEAAPKFNFDELIAQRRLRFIFKPLKPSKFGLIFDPQKEREMSTDRNQDSAQQVALTQKQLYDDMTKRLGNKGMRVLLVEDNRVNQMVLLKFLSKAAIPVETVLDGAQCTDKVFAQPHGYYSIILCDLHMPNKDGYQTCKEIRKWEKKNKYPYLPIIALSANVLGDVYAKCVEAGFNSYVTKPVDFKELSTVMLTFLDPDDPDRPIEFMKPKK